VERAVRYRAFSLRAVERILAVTAKPKSLWKTLTDDMRQRLGPMHTDPPVPPRSTAEYQSLLDPEPPDEADPKSQDDRPGADDGKQADEAGGNE
jgi:hypothetical protein